MSTRIPIAQEGNLGADPQFGVSENGTHWVQFTLGVNDRVRDPASGEWKDGKTVFHQVSAFGQLADNVRASLKRGDRALVTGMLEFTSWEKDGETHRGTRILAEGVGPSLRWRTAQIQRDAARDGVVQDAVGPAAAAPVTDWPTAVPGGSARPTDAPPETAPSYSPPAASTRVAGPSSYQGTSLGL